jgi:uroporphyrinogen-III synthase
MRVLLTKKISTSDLDLVQSWDWSVEITETLNIIPVEVTEIKKADVWVVSSRNSINAVKKFIDQAPGSIYCIGKWTRDELRKTGTKSSIHSFVNMKKLAADLADKNFGSLLYFCGEEHRQDFEEGLQDSATKTSKVITHQSQMTFPVVKNTFDAVFVFSPRSAESLLKNNSFNKQTIFACIGSTTASYLNSRGITNTFIPTYPDTSILLEEFHNQILNLKS